MLEGCGEKVCFQFLFKSGERVILPDVDWQGTPLLGIGLGKATVPPDCAGSWDSQLQTFGVGPK